jgi:hypothetical protein
MLRPPKRKNGAASLPALRFPLHPIPHHDPQPIPHDHLIYQGQEYVFINKLLSGYPRVVSIVNSKVGDNSIQPIPTFSILPKVFAGVTIALLPIIVIYFFFSDRITAGMTSGSIKG